MINQTTIYLGQSFYFYHVCVPDLTDVELKLYNLSNTFIATIPMTQIATSGAYRAQYIAPTTGVYVGIASSASAAASTDVSVKIRASSLTELTVIPPPPSMNSVTISNAVGVGVKCD